LILCNRNLSLALSVLPRSAVIYLFPYLPSLQGRLDDEQTVPVCSLFKFLEWAGLKDEAIQVVRRLYNNNTTTIRSSTGPSPPITINAGVKQGCPLSPIIFNLAIEPILRAVSRPNIGYHLHDQKIDSLAYADDLALIAKTPAELQQLMSITGRVATWAGLRLNARKCATLHVDGRHREAVRTTFEIHEDNPVILAEGDEYEHLGVPTGYHVAYSAEKVLDIMTANLDKVDASPLGRNSMQLILSSCHVSLSISRTGLCESSC
jgi:hypothetical protein